MRTGVRIEVTQYEEARLIGLAVAQSCAAGASTLSLNIGALERNLALRDGVPSELFSVKLGAVGLTERFITTDRSSRRSCAPCEKRYEPRLIVRGVIC